MDVATFSTETTGDALATALSNIVRSAVRAELGAFQSGDPEELLDADAAAGLLGMTPRALRRASERNALPFTAIRVGRRLRWRRGDLLALARATRSEV